MTRIVDTTPDEIDVHVVTRDRDHGVSTPYPGLSGQTVSRGRARVTYLNVRSPSQWVALTRCLRANPPTIVYLNSYWSPSFTMVPVIAIRVGLFTTQRVLLAPRGEFSNGALQMKSGKKRLVDRLWAPIVRSAGVLWHATAEMEAADIRAQFPDGKLIIVDEPLGAIPGSTQPSIDTRGPLRAVFVGRISPKKNLKLCLEALQLVRSPVKFDIFGPIEDRNYWAECLIAAAGVPPFVTVSYRGELAAQDVVAVFAEHEAFIFPTLGENFGHVIAESLSASCPVFCSDQTPWSDVLRRSGGFALVSPSATDLAEVIDSRAAASEEDRRLARAQAGRGYAEWWASSPKANVLVEALRVCSKDD